MSVETAVASRATTHAGLAALIGTRVYPEVAPQNPTAPFLIYQRISTRRQHVMGALPPVAQPRIQLDGYAATKTQVLALAEQMLQAFSAWSGTVSGTVVQYAMHEDERGSVELLDKEAQLRRVSMDFLVSTSET